MIKNKITGICVLLLTSIGMAGCAALGTQAEGLEPNWDYEVTDDESGKKVYEFEDFSITIPENWEDRYVVETAGDRVCFSSKAVRDDFAEQGIKLNPETGELFCVYGTEDYDFMKNAAYRKVIGNSDEQIYYISLIQGEPYYLCSEAAGEEWQELYQDVQWIANHVQLTNPGGEEKMVDSMTVYATATVNVRSKASTDGVIMGIVPQGYPVTAKGSAENGWLPVEYDGIKGYVSLKYLSTQGSMRAWELYEENRPIESERVKEEEQGSLADDLKVQETELRLYVGSYQEEAYYGAFSPQELPEYYEMVISYVADRSFGFMINKMDYETGAVVSTLVSGEAQFGADGTSASSYSSGYALLFTFPDHHNSYPDVTDVVVSGIPELEGKTLANNDVPGHEFS